MTITKTKKCEKLTQYLTWALNSKAKLVALENKDLKKSNKNIATLQSALMERNNLQYGILTHLWAD